MQSERCVNSAPKAISSNLLLVMGLAIAVGSSFPSEAAEFSNTELQLQYGRLKFQSLLVVVRTTQRS
jgi:hypothetical protein